MEIINGEVLHWKKWWELKSIVQILCVERVHMVACWIYT